MIDMTDTSFKHIFVISHRRSGTHLTIDTLRYNSGRFKNAEIITLERLFEGHENPMSEDELVKCLNNCSCIIKTHCLPDFSLYTSSRELASFIDNLLLTSYHIYIERNGKDVLTSLFHYMSTFDNFIKGESFSNFLKGNHSFPNEPNDLNRIEFWQRHKENWHEKLGDQFVFTYEDFQKNYSDQVRKLKSIVQEPYSRLKVIDVRNNPPLFSKILNRIQKVKINRSSVLLRKGTVGDYQNIFSEHEISIYESYTKKRH